MDESTLSPSWYTLRNKLAHSIGSDSSIHVGNLIDTFNLSYKIKISVTDSIYKAKAIRAILPEKYNLDKIVITVLVLDPHGNEIPYKEESYKDCKDVANVLCKALKGNPYFKGIVLNHGLINPNQEKIVGNLSVIIDKSVIQFYNDNMGDLCGNFNDIAANVFAQVISSSYKNNIKISFTTKDNKCPLQKRLYCY